MNGARFVASRVRGDQSVGWSGKRCAPPVRRYTGCTLDEAQIILMPGLDGTGDLFAPLLATMPPSMPRRVLSYPTDRAMGYDDLLAVVTGELAGDEPLILIAESFSGPLALRYAAAHPARIRAIVLCCSFVSSPLPAWARHLIHPIMFRLPVPSLGVRMLLTGWKSPRTLVQSVRQAIARVHPAVLAHRVRQVLTVNCGQALAECSVPILYLKAEHDVLVRASSADRLVAIRCDVTVRKISGPHLLLQASPVAAWSEIESFLRQHASLLPSAEDVLRETGIVN